MTYAGIMMEAMRLMALTDGRDLASTDDEIRKMGEDPAYSDKINRMCGSVNRCFSDLVRKSVIPAKVCTPSLSDADHVGRFIRFSLSQIIPDLDNIVRVVCLDGARPMELLQGTDYEIEGDELLVPDVCATLKITYRPTMPYIKTADNYDTEVPLPDTLASLVSYYIKGELMADDEPGEAASAMQYYEEAIADMRVKTEYTGQGAVDVRYSMGMLGVW